MEPLTWCTRRLGGSVAASEESTIAVTLAKVAATTSSRLSTNANPVNDCSSTTTWICETTCRLTDTSEDANGVLRHCHCWSSSATPEHDGPPLSLFLPNRQNQSNVCDLCERLRGRSCDYPTLDEKSTEGRFDRITRRGQRQVVNRDVNHSMISSKISQRDRLVSDASSTSYVSSVVRWSLRPERSFRWTRQKHALAWTILFLLVLVPSTSANLQKGMSRGSSKEEGVCQSIDIRNSVRYFSRLKGCRLVEGFVQILLIDNAEPSEYANISFPELKEITGYLLLYRVKGLRSIGRLFPNLTVIRGHSLFINYALVAFEMMNLQEIGLHSLTTIVRGSVRFEKNPALCYVDTIDWDLIAKAGKGEHVIAKKLLIGVDRVFRDTSNFPFTSDMRISSTAEKFI